MFLRCGTFGSQPHRPIYDHGARDQKHLNLFWKEQYILFGYFNCYDTRLRRSSSSDCFAVVLWRCRIVVAGAEQRGGVLVKVFHEVLEVGQEELDALLVQWGVGQETP